MNRSGLNSKSEAGKSYLDKASNILRGNTDHSEFRDYVFALLFDEKIQFKTT